MPTDHDKPHPLLAQDFGHETPFPVGRERAPLSWITLEDLETDGVPTGLPWRLDKPEQVEAIVSGEHTAPEADSHEDHGHHAHPLPPDNRRLHFGLAGLAAGLVLGWLAATLL